MARVPNEMKRIPDITERVRALVKHMGESLSSFLNKVVLLADIFCQRRRISLSVFLQRVLKLAGSRWIGHDSLRTS